VGESDPFGGGQGAVGLGRLLGQQLAALGGGEQAGMDGGAVQDTACNQAVEADPGLVQSVVAATLGRLGDSCQILF
jgi:hypothetical protein